MKPKQKAYANFSKTFRALAIGATFIAVTAVGVNASGSALAAAVSEFFGWSMPAGPSGNAEPADQHFPLARRSLFDRIITGDLSSLMGPGVEFTTQVYADDFSTNNSATYTTSGAIGASGWSVARSGADWGARRHTTTTRLELTNDVGGTANVNGWVLASTASSSFSSPYNTTLSSNPGPVTWTFNMRQSQANPAGFAAGNYGVAFIVAGTSTTNSTTGSGYAVVLGQSGTTDPVRLTRYSGGIQGTMTNIITSNTAGLTDFGTDFLSVKVVYTPSTNTWELLLRNDGGTAFADPASGTLVSQGTAVDSTSTGTALALMGGFWQGATTAGQPAYFDNTVVSVETPSPGTVEFSAASYSDLEGSTKSITVNRVGGSLGTASVDYTTGGGSATGALACGAGIDYITSSGTLNWADGDSAAKSFNVQLCTDGVVDNEDLQLTLSNAVGPTISGTNPVTLSITDNPPGTLQLNAASSSADENLPNWSILASRAGGSGGAVAVDYAVTGGTAMNGASCTAGVDYVLPAGGTLNWANLDTANKTITLQLCPDLVSYEGPETVIIEISNVQGGASPGSPTTHTVTINDMPAGFSNPSPIGIPNVGPSSLYPSNIMVAGVPGSLSNLSVTLSSVTHTYPDDIFVLLVGPGGQTFVLQGLAGGGGNITNRTYTFSDSAANLLADEASNPSGTYKPTNYFPTAGWPPPAPGAPYSQPGPSGTDTLNGIFGGIDPNGTWSLYVNDFADPDGGAINGGWSLQIQTTVPTPGTLEFSSAAFNGQEGGLAAINVKRVGGTLGAATVDYATSGGTATGGAACGAGVDFVNTSGTLTWADGDGAQKSFNVQTCGDSDTGESTESATLTLSNPTGIPISGTNPATLNIENNSFGGSIFSNHNPITIPSSGPSTPYPSTITVSGVTGTISNMRLTLNNLSHTYTGDIMMLLVGPQGQKFVPMGNAGSNSQSNGITFKLWDGAADLMPTAPLASGEYKPTSYFDSGDFTFPAPTGPYSKPAPVGADTFMSTFGGTDPNGTWSLYVADLADPDTGSIAGGWDLEIVGSTPVPGTVEFSSAAYNGPEGSMATITAKRVGGSLGAISVDYATSDGTSAGAAGGAACGAGVDYVSASGTVNWADGETSDKSFTVPLCSDPLTGESTETVDLTLSNPVGTSITGINPAVLNIENNSFDGSVFSNPAAINIPALGTSSPYPSTITVSGMSGAITEVRMVLKNFSHTYTSDVDILLVGPQGQKFVVMADVAGNNPINGVTLSLYDAAAANMTSGPLASGSYKPTDIAAAPDFWPSPAPAGPYNQPAPWGGMTFGSVFNGSDPNGAWSLYVYDSISPDGGSIADGWELQIASAETVRFNPGDYITTETSGTVSLTVVRASSDNAATVDYTLGSAGALYPAVGAASCAPGIDYINTPGTVNFGIGELTRNIDITLCDDAVFDGLKIILPELSNPTGGLVLGSPRVATVFINDDETPPTLSISDVTVNEADGTASFLVTQSFITNSLTQFNYSTSDVSALAGFDYTGATNATGQITAGSTTTNIVVPILQDTGFEETETFNVAFTNIVNATAGDPMGVGTITDDDTAASYVVTTTNNLNDGTCDATHCSLREAITASNAAQGIITFAPGVTGTITFSASRPQITNNTVINGPGANLLAVSGNNAVTVFEIPNAGSAVTIRGLTIRNGFNVDFASGGGINSNGVLLVENSIITANQGQFAGGIQTFAPLTIRNSTLSNNVGGGDGSLPGCANIGGAIDSSSDVTINIINSTITGNSVSTNCSANAGAINLFAGRVVITNSTITNNTGSNFSGAIDGGSASTSIVRNSIIAGNTGDPDEPDMNDIIFESQGFNIIGNPGTITAFNQPTDQTGTTGSPLNPGLGALANNGGTTPTHALLTGSPALDKGNSFGSTTDQRGSGRPYDDPGTANAAGGDGSDIGAYEAIVPVITITGGPLDFGSVLVGGFSAEQTYTVSGANLTGDITVTAPAGFEVSATSGSGFGPAVTLTQSGGSVPVTTIYVRFAPASPGATGGNITNESPGTATRDVAVSGNGMLAGTIQFSSATPATSETNADHVYNVVVTRTGGSYGAVSVDYTATDGTATTAGNDYSIASATGTLNWADGDSADKNVEITIKGDLTFEPDETVNLALSNATGGAALGSPAASVLTITNDDGQPAISIDDVTFTGADSLVGPGFTVTLSNPSSQTVTVHYQTANDTAIASEDYTAASGTLTFNPGETVQNVPVTILPDTVNEATEQFFLNLDTPVNATIADGQGIGTIPNDDPDVSFSIDDVTHTEGNSGTTSYTFTITKSGSTTQTTSVDWSTVNGSAAAPGDFSGVSATTVSFLPAEMTKQVTVEVNGDTSFEADETFIVRLSNPVSAFLTDGDGLGTIQNDDSPQIFLVNVNSDADDGTCDAVNCSLREAINAVNIAGGQIDFAPNVTGSISLLSALPPLASSNATVINGPGAGVLAVKRDSSISALRIFDIQGSGVFTISGLAINDGDVRPIGGAFNNLGGAIRIMAGHGVTINSCSFTNNWANNGAAIYNGANPATSPLTVNNSTFTANNANQSGGGIENRFSNRLTVNGSTFDANGANNFGGGIHNIASGVVFVNDSTFTGNVANTGAAINNDDTGSLTITRSIISGNHAVVGGGISNKNGGLDVFNSTISGNDASEGGGAYNHVATMNFYNSTISGNTATSIGGGIYYTFQGPSHGTIQNCTITNNHGPNGGGVMVFNGSSVVRAGNTILAGNTGSQGPDLYGTIYSNGYNILGTTGGTYANFVATTGDQVGQFSVINPMLGSLADNGGPTRTHLPLSGSPAIDSGNAFGETADQRGFTRTVNGATDIGAAEVQNAPTQISAFAGSPQSVIEGTVFSPLQARVLDAGNAPVGGVTVTFTAPPSGASGLFANGTAQTTAITDANGVATSSVLTANNTGGSFNVTAAFAASPTASFALTILESPRVISVNDVTFTGADALVGSGFTVSLSAVSVQTITVHFQTADGTAIAGEDYTSTSGTLTFNPGETMQNVPVTILPDTVNETTEQFFLNLDTPVNATISDGQGIGTIPNDDPDVSFSIDDVTHNEGNSGTTAYTFTITKNGSTSQTTSVDWSTVSGSATAPDDFAGVSATTLSFLPSESSKQVTVLVNGDIFVEGNETFTVDLSNPVNATISGADGTGTITNDDNPPIVTYVDDDWTALAMGADPDGAGPAIAIGYDAFDTIQEGIDAVTNPGTVSVYAGTYRENPNVNKAVTLTGANAGIAGDAVRGAESIIGASGNTGNVVTIASNNITIDGFTIDGDDPNVAGFPIHSGDDVNASYAMRSGSQNHLQVKNNIVKRVSIGFRGEGDSKDNSIANNWFDSIGSFDFGYAVTLRNNYYADVTGNRMTRVWTGVHLNNFSFAGGPVVMNVSGNNVKAYAAGLFSTLRYNAASPLAVSGNQFAPETGAVDDNVGILLASTQDAVSATFTGNTIVNTHYGIILTTVSTANVIDFGATNSVTGAVKAGVYVTDNLTFNPVSTASVTLPATTVPMWVKLSGISLSGPGNTGVKIENTRAPGTEIANNVVITGANIGFFSKGLEVVGPLTNVTMTGSTIAASGTGIAVQNAGATPVSLTAHYNRIVTDTYAIENGSNQPLSLENNWWGCNAGPGNTGCGASTGTGQDFDPWIVLGIDAAPNPIAPGGNTTVTADMTHNSAGLVPSATDFVPQVGVTYGATQGTVAPPAGNIVSGQGTTTFTSTSAVAGTASATVDNQTVNTNIGITLPSFSINDVTQSEGDSGTTSFTFVVTKTGATGLTSSVNYATQNGTASAGSDFTGVGSTMLTFGPSETIKEVTINVTGDTVYENNETFTVELSGEANASIADVSGLGSITNDDAPPAFSISDVTLNEGNSGTTNFSFNVTKTGDTDLTSSVSWFNSDGTATSADGDYNPATGVIEFNPGDTTVPITVQVYGDFNIESDETFTVHLNSAIGATISDADGTGTITNDDLTPNVTYVDDDWTALSPGTDPDGAGPANAIGYDAFDTVQEGIDAVAASGQVNVHAGTYDEDVNAGNPGVRIIGAGAGSTNIRGPIGGGGATVQITASNVEIAGFTVTRLGNDTTDWNNPGLNNAAVAIQGQAVTGAVIRDNMITGNRTGVDINNSNGHTVRNNVIDFNRVGLIFRHQTDSMTVVENFITNNWALGVVFLDGSGGTNSPQQSALLGIFSNNDISANWYAQIVDRQSGGSLPAPGTTNLKNFKGNWYGTTTPAVTTANSAEPGYAAQIPVAYGGTATAPGGQPDIAGPASANLQYQPQLLSGVDTNIETTPGRGTFGFQGVANVPILNIQDHTFTGVDSLGESQGFTVTLTGETTQIVTVHYQTNDGTALDGQDYTGVSGTLTFNPGETSKVIPVDILPDTVQEPTEAFTIDLDTPVNAGILDGNAIGTIPNDDAAPSFSIDSVTQSEGVGGFTTFVFFVTKTGGTALPSSVDFATEAVTATAGATCGAGVDYETRSGTLNFAASDTSQMVLVNVCGDTLVEPDETFNVHLSNPVNGSITEGGGLGTIQNNTTPAVQFQSATYLEDESQTAVITLVRTGDTSGSSTVAFATSNGTGAGGSCSTLGIDFASVNTTVTFAATETEQTVNVPVCMDTLFEATFETANLALSNPVGSTVLGDQSTAVLNLNDTAAQHKSAVPIMIGDNGPANPYPATIVVSGAPSVTGTMRITLFDLTHARPEDLDILLVAPNGQSMVLTADAGGTNALAGNGATITFDDTAGAVLPDSAPITTGKYEPTTWGPVAPFISPAPAGPYAMPGSSVGGSINLGSVFGAVHPNGTWQLFIRDQGGLPPLGAGQIAAGWGLQFLAPTDADASISGRVTTASGNGIRNAVVKITGGNLTEPRYVATGAFGSYLFEGLPVGQTYIVQVSAKRFRFAQPSMVVTLQDATSLDFVANPQE